jgi:hypothetical protein
MTKDDIIRMADVAKLTAVTEVFEEELMRFADLVAAAERKDALRYRWLKDNNSRFSWNPSKYNKEIISGFAAFGTGYCGFEFEAAVDKAMGNK